MTPSRLLPLVLVPLVLAANAFAATPLALKVLVGGHYSGAGSLPLFHVGQVLTITLTVPAKISKGVSWPHVNGLTDNGSGLNPGPHSEDFNDFVTPARAGDFTIPSFDLHADDGQVFHVGALTLRVGK